MARIRLTPDVSLDADEIALDFVRASGPGGQKVNKASTAVQLRFDVAGSPSLPEALKARLLALAGSRATASGVLVLDAREHRSQARNRQAAIERLVELIRRASRPPTPRRKTHPTPASRLRRLDAKRRRSQVKHFRRKPEEERS